MINSNLFKDSPKVNVISPKSVGIKPFIVGDNLFNMEEIWKDISNHEGLYQISNYGNVKSLVTSGLIGKNLGLKENRILKCSLNEKGYLRIRLAHSDGKRRTYKVHRLVALAFIHNPVCKLEVNHINGIKTDNRVENLEWSTRRENVQHSYDIGCYKTRKSKNAK